VANSAQKFFCKKNDFSMDIPEIKSRLKLSDVLAHYGLKPDKHNRLHCPFHPDNTPSLQVYEDTGTVYCFSTNCPTHGKSLDVIDFILHKEQLSKHQAILKAKALIGGESPSPEQLSRIAVLSKMFGYFTNAVPNSGPAKAYLEARHLDYKAVEVGYNSGQFHHGTRKNPHLIKSCLKVGLLLDKGHVNSRTGEKAYSPFGKGCIVFALRNPENKIVSLYFRSTSAGKTQRHFYLKGRQGLYPGYPKANAQRLILTESIIDAATLLQQKEITARYSILALYGTNGFTDEHRAAIKNLHALEEVIFFLNGDEAGRKAVDIHSQAVRELRSGITISAVDTPQGEDVNSLLDGHSAEVLAQLLESRRPVNLSFSPEKPSNEKEKRGRSPEDETHPALPRPDSDPEPPQPALNTAHPHNIGYKGAAANYWIKGGLKGSLDSLKVSVQIVRRQTRTDVSAGASAQADYRAKADLYEYRQVQTVSQKAGRALDLQADAIQKDLTALARQLEEYREKTRSEQTGGEKPRITIPPATVTRCMELLKSPDLMERIGQLIGQAGVVGEEATRALLFVVASSYKMADTLHGLIQGSTGSGKTRLLKTICSLTPPEDTIKLTRITEASLYNYPEDYLSGKLLGLEDLDGLGEEALYALRELISNEVLTSSTTTKTEDGRLVAMQKTVRGPVATLSCTTKGELYEDNMSRVFLVAVDESPEQTQRIIDYQQRKAAGRIDPTEETRARELLQNCIRLLKPCPVVNPYASRVQLPAEAHKIRRLNELYLSFVRQITLLHQHQRAKDKQGRLLTAPQDLKAATDILFESILLKVDELDGPLRGFYERLKDYVQQKGKDHEFTQREARQALKVSKTGCQNSINRLLELEYIQKTGAGHRNTYHYRITYWDSLAALRGRIKAHLDEQLQAITGQNGVAAEMAGQDPEQERLTGSDHRP